MTTIELENIELGSFITASRLSREQIALQFDDLGYVALAEAVDPKVIHGHLEGLDQFDRSNPTARIEAGLPVREGLNRLRKRYHFQESHEPTLRLQFAPILAAALRQLLGQEPAALFTTTFKFSPMAGRVAAIPDLSPHLHNFEIVTNPPNAFLLAWIALEDVRLQSGPMWILPGSHKEWSTFPQDLAAELRRHPRLLAMLELAPRCQIQFEQWSAMLASIASIARKLVETRTPASTIRPHAVLLKKGDALIFDPSLLHGTLPPNPPNAQLSRQSCNVRYISADCQLWNYAHRLGGRGVETPSHLEIRKNLRRTHFGTVFLDYLGAKYASLY